MHWMTAATYAGEDTSSKQVADCRPAILLRRSASHGSDAEGAQLLQRVRSIAMSRSALSQS